MRHSAWNTEGLTRKQTSFDLTANLMTQYQNFNELSNYLQSTSRYFESTR